MENCCEQRSTYIFKGVGVSANRTHFHLALHRRLEFNEQIRFFKSKFTERNERCNFDGQATPGTCLLIMHGFNFLV